MYNVQTKKGFFMFKSLKKLSCIVFTLLITFSFVSESFAHSAGGGLVWIRSPYKGHDDYILPFPSVQVDTKYFFIKGLSLGLNLYKDDAGEHELTLGVMPGSLIFDPDKTDEFRLKFLDKRDISLDAYIQYIRTFNFGSFGAKIYMDVLGNADGFGIDGFYKLPIYINNFTLSPGVGINFTSEERNQYYYGVSLAESKRSGVIAYEPEASITPFVFVEASLLTENGLTLFALAKYSFYSDEITDSPMVGEDHGLIVSAGAMYNF